MILPWLRWWLNFVILLQISIDWVVGSSNKIRNSFASVGFMVSVCLQCLMISPLVPEVLHQDIIILPTLHPSYFVISAHTGINPIVADVGCLPYLVELVHLTFVVLLVVVDFAVQFISVGCSSAIVAYWSTVLIKQ